MGVAAWERERDARGGGLGLARPLVSHRGCYLPTGGSRWIRSHMAATC